MKKRYNVAIMGSGHIARDLYRKIEKDKLMRLYLVASRNLMSEDVSKLEIIQLM